MNILKLFILNMMLLYFLRYNIKFGVILLCITIVYLLLLNNNNIEGNNIDDAKRELKYLDMLNIDRLLNKLIGVFEHSEQSCYGEYTNYSPCDKKCGKSYKYKTYRIKQRAGILGANCEQDDGFRKKKACDKDDGIYPCSVGDKCNVGEDCDTGNCDPTTGTCVTVKVCSDENLNLCDPLKCEDLNNQYDITGKHYVYDVGDKICKLENLDENNNDDDDGDTNQTIKLPKDMECPWYMNKDDALSNMTTNFCKMRNPDTVFLSEDGATLRASKYGITTLDPGLYCKEGYKFYPLRDDDGNDDRDEGKNNLYGVSDEIKEEDVTGEWGRDKLIVGCKNLINSGSDGHVVDEKCEGGYWPPLKFFKDNINQKQIDDGLDKISITEMCKRCDNGKVLSTNLQCAELRPRPCVGNNQYTLMNNTYRKTPGYTSLGTIGKNEGCDRGPGSDPPNINDLCDNNNCPSGTYQLMEANRRRDANSTEEKCCSPCPRGTYNPDPGSITCLAAKSGEFVSGVGQATAESCPAANPVSIDLDKEGLCDGCEGPEGLAWVNPVEVITPTPGGFQSRSYNLRTGCGRCDSRHKHDTVEKTCSKCGPNEGSIESKDLGFSSSIYPSLRLRDNCIDCTERFPLGQDGYCSECGPYNMCTARKDCADEFKELSNATCSECNKNECRKWTCKEDHFSLYPDLANFSCKTTAELSDDNPGEYTLKQMNCAVRTAVNPAVTYTTPLPGCGVVGSYPLLYTDSGYHEPDCTGYNLDSNEPTQITTADYPYLDNSCTNTHHEYDGTDGTFLCYSNDLVPRTTVLLGNGVYPESCADVDADWCGQQEVLDLDSYGLKAKAVDICPCKCSTFSSASQR